MSLDLEKLLVGQEIVYNDLHDEIEELRRLIDQLSKKNWLELLQGKMVSWGLGKLSDNALRLIQESFGENKLLE